MLHTLKRDVNEADHRRRTATRLLLRNTPTVLPLSVTHFISQAEESEDRSSGRDNKFGYNYSIFPPSDSSKPTRNDFLSNPGGAKDRNVATGNRISSQKDGKKWQSGKITVMNWESCSNYRGKRKGKEKSVEIKNIFFFLSSQVANLRRWFKAPRTENYGLICENWIQSAWFIASSAFRISHSNYSYEQVFFLSPSSDR